MLDFMSDEKYVAMEYRMYMGKKINFEKPEKLSEKICWLKIHDHNPLYTTLVDKYAVKSFLADLARSTLFPRLACTSILTIST